METVPLLLQCPQICLKLSLGLLVPHGEQLTANLQSVDETALIPLEQHLFVLRMTVQEIKHRKECGGKMKRRKLLSSDLLGDVVSRGLCGASFFFFFKGAAYNRSKSYLHPHSIQISSVFLHDSPK